MRTNKGRDGDAGIKIIGPRRLWRYLMRPRARRREASGERLRRATNRRGFRIDV